MNINTFPKQVCGIENNYNDVIFQLPKYVKLLSHTADLKISNYTCKTCTLNYNSLGNNSLKARQIPAGLGLILQCIPFINFK